MHTCVNSNVNKYFYTDLSFTNISIIQKKPNIILLYKIREEIFRSQISVYVNVQLCAYTGIFKAREQVETFRKKKIPFFSPGERFLVSRILQPVWGPQ